VTEVVVEPLSVPAPVEGDKLQVTPLLLESLVTVAVMVVDCPAARDAPALEARAMAMGAGLLLQLAVRRAATRTKIQREDRVVRAERGWDM